MRFDLGRVVATPGALEALTAAQTAPGELLLLRHASGDWGEVPMEDARENELSVMIFIFLDDVAELVQTTYKAEITAMPEGPARTRLQVRASRRDWQRTLDSWVQNELVENGAAAVDPAEIEGAQEEPSAAPPSQTDILEQIRKLDELRDAGVLSEEGFEAKKRELLDRL